MRRTPLGPVALAVAVLLAGCATEEAPSPYLQPGDVVSRGDVEVVLDEPTTLSFGRGAPCYVRGAPEPDMGSSGDYVVYEVTDRQDGQDVDGGLMSAALAPEPEVLQRLPAYLDAAPDACLSDIVVELDQQAADEVAAAAEVPVDDVRVLRRPIDELWRAYVIVDGRVAVVQVDGPGVADAVDLTSTVAAAVARLRDYPGDLPPQDS
ncbi:hypothetical protein [Pseudokineococcus sp. 1T1Z-3]|uniref:hypothetical protein n=1 Tax=Pseudokineococcus sp. 1T1Z-3 TaxID=3132745 RepID=UPI0030B5DFF8